MEHRTLGRTGIEVSEVGFGCWQLGNDTDWGGMDDRTAHDLVHEAIDLGVTLFDTSPNYGSTNSERLLGESLRGRRNDVVLVSKFGRTADDVRDFSIDRFETGLEESLRRLRTDYLDVFLLHNPDAALYETTEPLWAALDRAAARGKIRHYGASLDRASEIEKCLGQTESTVLEILFNALHQDARRAFPLVRSRGCGAIVKVPLDSGWLTGRFDAASRFDGIRSRWTSEEIAERAGLVDQLDWLTSGGATLATRALQYVLSYDEVSCVIPGMRNREQLHANVGAVGGRLNPEERARLEAFWDAYTDRGTNLLPW